MFNFNHFSKNEIPVFFSTDDNYVPYLDVAIASLIDNASKDYKYRIVVLNTGILPENIEKFIIECNKGVLTHRLSYPVGFLAMLTLPVVCSFTVALPVALVNLFLNVLPTLALRYNTPMLHSVLKRLKRKSLV